MDGVIVQCHVVWGYNTVTDNVIHQRKYIRLHNGKQSLIIVSIYRPQFSGRYCAGSRRRYRVCHKQKCQSDMNNYRDMKCRELGPSSNQQGATSTAEHWISVDESKLTQPASIFCSLIH